MLTTLLYQMIAHSNWASKSRRRWLFKTRWH